MSYTFVLLTIWQGSCFLQHKALLQDLPCGPHVRNFFDKYVGILNDVSDSTSSTLLPPPFTSRTVSAQPSISWIWELDMKIKFKWWILGSAILIVQKTDSKRRWIQLHKQQQNPQLNNLLSWQKMTLMLLRKWMKKRLSRKDGILSYRETFEDSKIGWVIGPPDQLIVP